MLAGGITLILVGYLGSAITGTIGGTAQAYHYGCHCTLPALGAWPFAWVPFLHPFMAINSIGSWGMVAGIAGAISAGTELAGLIMAIVGQIGGPAEPSTGNFTLRFGAPDSDGGLSGVLTF